MRVLVTGASGLLGINVALETARHHTVVGTVHSRPIRTRTFTVQTTDLLKVGAPQKSFDDARPDWVIHCAALANVDACERSPDLAQRLNGDLPGELAQIAARGGARFLHVSTDAVFDGRRGSYLETDVPNPLSVYAQTKLNGERAVAQANPDAIIARVNLFGWSPSGKRSLAEWFLNNLRAGVPIMGFTDVNFCPLLANHLAHMLIHMLEMGLSGLYHVVSSECSSKFDFGMALARRFNLDHTLISPASVSAAGLEAARSPNLTLRADKLTEALGAPPPDLAAGLDEFYRLYEESYPERLRAMAA